MSQIVFKDAALEDLERLINHQKDKNQRDKKEREQTLSELKTRNLSEMQSIMKSNLNEKIERDKIQFGSQASKILLTKQEMENDRVLG